MAKTTTKKTTPRKTTKKRATTKSITKRKTKAVAKINMTVEEKELIDWMDITGNSKLLNDKEKVQFLHIAKAYNLNPFKKEIFCNVYYADDPNRRTLSIVVGYPAFLKRAERLKILDGWNCSVPGGQPEKEYKAVCTIYRKDWKFPFVHEAWLSECVQTTKAGNPNSFWRKMPKFMLRKVCISQAFRLCFPDEFEEMPYLDIEIDRDYLDPIDVTPKEKNEELTYVPDDKKEPEKKDTICYQDIVKFINDHQKELFEKGVIPSEVLSNAKGSTPEELIIIYNKLKETL